ncbi:MAG: DUF5714 domain-containing protein [Melioribacteraceae bacterium]|nr:DUF5714 domain-containing protein [Melioribacteraceae bacterium]
MENFKSGCLICGADLIYSENSEELICFYCKEEFNANEKCINNHYVCNKCHSSNAIKIIEDFCNRTELTDPIQIANILMGHPSIKMHGNEHHFLVPAVMLTSYYNLLNDKVELKNKLLKAKKRAEQILGGFCGTHGNCGAAVGTGVFISLITNSTPLSINEWKLCNLMTAKSLFSVSEFGGPRCCKRDVYLSISEAIIFVKENFNIEIPSNEKISCLFSQFNKECIKNNCRFFIQ